MKKTGYIGRAQDSSKTKNSLREPRELAEKAASLASEKKAYKILIMEVTGKSSLSDYIIICHGKSTRQVKAVAEHIREKLKKEGVRLIGSEGLSEGRWVLLDYSDVIIHIFQEPLRVFYDLEGLWSDAPSFLYEDNPEEA